MPEELLKRSLRAFIIPRVRPPAAEDKFFYSALKGGTSVPWTERCFVKYSAEREKLGGGLESGARRQHRSESPNHKSNSISFSSLSMERRENECHN